MHSIRQSPLASIPFRRFRRIRLLDSSAMSAERIRSLPSRSLESQSGIPFRRFRRIRLLDSSAMSAERMRSLPSLSLY